MMTYLIVFLGAGIGGTLRHAVNVGCGRLCGTEFPWGILIINVTGCFIMGCAAAYFALRSEGGMNSARLFLTTGILGGYTTFSAFSLDTAVLWERGALWPAAAYVIASVVLSIAALFAGLALVRAVA